MLFLDYSPNSPADSNPRCTSKETKKKDLRPHECAKIRSEKQQAIYDKNVLKIHNEKYNDNSMLPYVQSLDSVDANYNSNIKLNDFQNDIHDFDNDMRNTVRSTNMIYDNMINIDKVLQPATRRKSITHSYASHNSASNNNSPSVTKTNSGDAREMDTDSLNTIIHKPYFTFTNLPLHSIDSGNVGTILESYDCSNPSSKSFSLKLPVPSAPITPTTISIGSAVNTPTSVKIVAADNYGYSILVVDDSHLSRKVCIFCIFFFYLRTSVLFVFHFCLVIIILHICFFVYFCIIIIIYFI